MIIWEYPVTDVPNVDDELDISVPPEPLVISANVEWSIVNSNLLVEEQVSDNDVPWYGSVYMGNGVSVYFNFEVTESVFVVLSITVNHEDSDRSHIHLKTNYTEVTDELKQNVFDLAQAINSRTNTSGSF